MEGDDDKAVGAAEGTAGKERRLRSLFSLSAFHFFDDGFTDSIYILLPFLAVELHLSLGEVGLLRGIAGAAVSLLQLPMALLGEKVGELTVIACGAFGLAAGFILLSSAASFVAAFLSLIVAKGTNAGQHSLVSSVVSRIFELSGRRAAMGTYNFSGDMGKVCIPFLLAVSINLWGWRQGLLFLSLMLLVAVPLFWALSAKSNPPRPSHPAEARHKGDPALRKKSWGIGNRRSFSALLTVGAIDNATRTALLTFLPFLLVQKGIPRDQVGFALTLLFAGGAAGKFLCGIMAERFGVIPMVVATEAITSAGILSLIWSPILSTWVVLPLVGIVLNGTSSVLYATVAEIISSSARSRGYGLYYAVTLGTGAVAPVVYGVVSDYLGVDPTVAAIGLVILVVVPLTKYLR